MRLVEEILEALDDVRVQINVINGEIDKYSYQRRHNMVKLKAKWLDNARAKREQLIMQQRELRQELYFAKKFWEEKVG